MASQAKKPVPQRKAHKDDTDAVPRKQPKEKPKENRSEAEIQKHAALRGAKARVKVLNSAAEEIRARIRTERTEAIHDPSVIQAEIERARLNWEKVQAELDRFKGLSRKRKDEIDEWKAWYAKLPETEKPAGLERLQAEIKWRADEIASQEAKTGDLIPQELEARGAFEMAKHRLAAHQAGFHKRPLEEDPRLKSALAELDKAGAAVDQLEPERTERK